jgi:hypothetical protein
VIWQVQLTKYQKAETQQWLQVEKQEEENQPLMQALRLRQTPLRHK